MLKRLCLGALTLFFTLSLLTACEHQSAKNNQVAQPGPLASINKSPNDDREYRALLLPNQLQVVLVSDPSIEVAAVSMGVGVGSYQDPDSQLGLAHYLEHMLFLGTEKYPEPNSFQKFVDENAGVWNAYTAVDHTNYFFQLNAEQLDQALDYFSDYFKKPTFDPQYSDKERNAVNSEWSMGRSQDNWILYRLSGITANPEHPAQRLTVGNLETLSDKPDSKLQEELLAFYDKYYSANNMRLTILAKQSLDELQALVEKHFASIANKKIDRPKVAVPGITFNEKGKIIHYRSLRELKQLMIEFPIVDNSHQWRLKPNAFINNLITSEEPGTLGEVLRREGLANSVYGYVDPDNYGKDGYLRIVAELTDKGLQNRDQIIAATFGYLELIKRQGVDKAYYYELKAMLEKDFANMAKPQPLQAAMNITRAQFDYPVDHLLDADYVYERFNKKAIESVLAQLRPENARIWHISNKEETSQSIPFYEGSYSIRDIEADELMRWTSLAKSMNFSLPPENPLFSQQKGELVESLYTKPHAVLSEAGVEAWLTHAQHYREDKGLIELQVNTDKALASIENLVLASLLNESFNLQNTTLIDRAARAGIQINLGLSAERSPVFSISGYASQHKQLLSELLEAFANFQISEQEFAQVQDRYLLNLANAKKAPPYQQMFGHRSRLLQQISWSDEEILPVARQLKREQLVAYYQQLFGDNLIRLYAFGNYTDKQIRDLALVAREKMNSQRLPENRYLLPYITPRANTRILYTESIEQTDSALLDGWIATQKSLPTQATLLVLNAILGNELFTQLRTNEQMGYVVGSAPAGFDDYPMYVMFVQSTNTDLVGIKTRLDRFRQEFLSLLEASTPETIEQIKRSEIANILQKPANFDAEAREFLHEFRVAQYEFDRKQRIIQALEGVSKEALLGTYKQLILNQAEGRMTIQLQGTHFADKPFANAK
jgi:protease-3